MNRIEFLASCNLNPDKLINCFVREYRFLSNFELCEVPYHRLVYPSSENAFQAEKSVLLSVRQEFIDITPSQAKQLGRKIILRKDWENIKVKKMSEIIDIKFDYTLYLKERLIFTGNAELIEGNWWHDNFWGDCVCDKCSEIEGQNNLGKILMNKREKIK